LRLFLGGLLALAEQENCKEKGKDKYGEMHGLQISREFVEFASW
jgi:hypothetical protein